MQFFFLLKSEKHISSSGSWAQAVPLARLKENMQWFMNWKTSTNAFHSQEIKSCAIRVEDFLRGCQFCCDHLVLVEWWNFNVIAKWKSSVVFFILEKALSLARCHFEVSEFIDIKIFSNAFHFSLLCKSKNVNSTFTPKTREKSQENHHKKSE